MKHWFRTSYSVGRENMVANPGNMYKTFRYGPYEQFTAFDGGDSAKITLNLDHVLCYVERDAGMGSKSEEQIVKMTQAFYAAKQAANKRIEWSLLLVPFKYTEAAKLLSKYAKLMDREDEEDRDTCRQPKPRDVNDVMSEETTMRRRPSQWNAADKGNKVRGVQHMDDYDSQKAMHTEQRLAYDETEESPESSKGTTNEVGKPDGT